MPPVLHSYDPPDRFGAGIMNSTAGSPAYLGAKREGGSDATVGGGAGAGSRGTS